jgi:hypothetical protein
MTEAKFDEKAEFIPINGNFNAALSNIIVCQHPAKELKYETY